MGTIDLIPEGMSDPPGEPDVPPAATVAPALPGQHTVDIDLTATGTGRVAVDGTPVENAVRALRVLARVGELTTVDLEIMARNGLRFTGSAYIGIPAQTAELLELLGWTPPDPPDGVLFWMWVSPFALDAIRAGAGDELPAGWRILRTLHVPAGSAGRAAPEMYLAQIIAAGAPMEAQGLVCTPVFQRHGGNGPAGGYLTVIDWGIPRPEKPLVDQAAQENSREETDAQ